jgi:GNAT superfamily N-acetyltransferase
MPGDRGFVLDLGRRTLDAGASEVRAAPPQDVEASYERLIDFVYGTSHVMLVAESSLEKLGFLALLDAVPDEVSGARQAFIAYMAVEPHARHRGVAAALLHRAEEVARSRGLPALALMVTEGNEEARSLYARMGFSTERRLLAKPLV